jgi:hypothetical protein
MSNINDHRVVFIGYDRDEISGAYRDYIAWRHVEPILEANKQMLDALEKLDECAAYWSEYDVPIGIHDRIKSAIAKAKGVTP